MNWPGEALLIKLWDTLADKGIGGLLKPWQIKREARAQIESRQLEIVALADAEKEAAEIRAGRMEISKSRYSALLSSPEIYTEKRIEPYIDTRSPLEITTSAMIGDALRREVNVAKAITYAEAELRDDTHPPSEQEIDADWLYRWRDYASTVSSEKLQSIWGSLLAGELKSPGCYSLRSLEFIKNISSEEAKKIEILSQFVIHNYIVRDQQKLLESQGITFSDLIDMQNLGLISGVEATGMTMTLNSTSTHSFLHSLCSYKRVLIAEHEDPKKEIKLNVYRVSTLGRQILNLGKFGSNEIYMRAVGQQLLKAGFTVRIADFQKISETQIQISNVASLN
jgi:hypothetical protein